MSNNPTVPPKIGFGFPAPGALQQPSMGFGGVTAKPTGFGATQPTTNAPAMGFGNAAQKPAFQPANGFPGPTNNGPSVGFGNAKPAVTAPTGFGNAAGNAPANGFAMNKPATTFGAPKDEEKKEVKYEALGAKTTEAPKVAAGIGFGNGGGFNLGGLSKPTETKPAETKPVFPGFPKADEKPAETKPAEVKPSTGFGNGLSIGNAKPAETKPAFGFSKPEEKKDENPTPSEKKETKPFTLGLKTEDKPATPFKEEEKKPALDFNIGTKAAVQPVAAAQPTVVKTEAKMPQIDLTEDEKQIIIEKYKVKQVTDLKRFEIQNVDAILSKIDLQIKESIVEVISEIKKAVMEKVEEIQPIAHNQVTNQHIVDQQAKQIIKMTEDIQKLNDMIRSMQSAKEDRYIEEVSFRKQSQAIVPVPQTQQSWTREQKMLLAACGAMLFCLLLVVAVK
ncbi:Nsp1p [Hexamita inflata]|uniref:Nsp1p n=1 Tax=Hexamita inflata TaxID=28002 RepID=A0AA86NUZ9_9EUKA|nr:Nsp1p [Hexamita inflata]CAI9969467.1 Nsp1p [Hexamita inflata]